MSSLYNIIFSLISHVENLSQAKVKEKELNSLISALHFSLIEVVCHDPKLFSISPPKESVEFFEESQKAIQTHDCYFQSHHLLSILKSLNSLSETSLIYRKLSFFVPLFKPLSFNETLLSTLPQIISHNPLSTYSRILSVISTSSDSISKFWSNQKKMLSSDFYARLLGLLLFDNFPILSNILSPKSPTFPQILNHLFTSELFSTLPNQSFLSISKFLLDKSLSNFTFRHIRTSYLERIDLYNRTFGKLRLLIFNLYSFLKQAPPDLLASLFNSNTCFNIFYNIKTMYSKTKSNKGLSSKFSLILSFLCKLGVFDHEFFYNNLSNQQFPSYCKSFCKYISNLLNPNKKMFPLLCVSTTNSTPSLSANSDENSINKFIEIFSDQVDQHNNDLPIVMTFLEICKNTKLSYPGLCNIFLPSFLSKFAQEQLGSVHKLLTILSQLDPICNSTQNRSCIQNFLKSFDFDQENQFDVVTNFYLNTKDNFGIDLTCLSSSIDTSLQRMVQQLPFDLASLKPSSNEAQKVNLFIEKIVKISFETSDLVLLKHLFHIFMDKQNPFLSVFSSNFNSVSADSHISDSDIIAYIHDMLDCILTHSQNLFPEPLYHRLNIFKFILIPTLNLLQSTSLIEIFSFYYQDWIQILKTKTPSLIAPSDSTLSETFNLFLRQYMILSVFSVVFKKLDKTEILQKLYPSVINKDDKLSKITKEIIGCINTLEQSLDTVYQVLIHLSTQQTGFTKDMVDLILHVHSFHFRSSLFSCLSSILMKTQSKISIISDFLIFNRKNPKNKRLLKFLPPEVPLNFGVKTYFEIQNLENLGPSLTKSFKSSLISQKFFAFQSKTQKSVDSNNPIEKTIDKDNSIELDLINSLPISLELVDLFSSISFQFQLEKETAIHSFGEVLQQKDLPLHHQVILFKVILNNPKHFENHKQVFLPCMLRYIGNEDTGGAGMHYFLRDMITLFCDWVSMNSSILSSIPMIRAYTSKAFKKVISKLADKSRSILCHNYSLSIKLMDCIKDYLCVDLKYLVRMLSIQEPINKKNISKSKLEDLRLWKYVGLSILEAMIIKNTNVNYMSYEALINSKCITITKGVLTTLLNMIKGNTSRHLSIKASNVLGLFLRKNLWIWSKSELESLISNTMFALNSKSQNFMFSVLNHISFYFPQIMFKDRHIQILIQKSARTMNSKSISIFLSCILNLFEFNDDLSQEFKTHPMMVKTLFIDLVYLLEKTSNSSDSLSNLKCIVVILKKFLNVPFADKVICVKHLIERLTHIKIFSFAHYFRIIFHLLIIDIANYIMTEEKQDNQDENVPSFSAMGSGVLASINESFQRIEKLHFNDNESSGDEVK
jgi:hypothetical protein